jgi:GAF domain-containing protein
VIAPENPANEAARLAFLQSLEILDTEPEEPFERLVRLAKYTLDVPIALVSLIDANRQWFKARVGLGVSETPRSISFCGHALKQRGVFYIPDTLADLRFSDNPLVTSAPNIRFYAGAPLVMEGGLVMGTLCIIDTRPRTLDVGQLRALRDLADCVQGELELRHSRRQELRLLSPGRRGNAGSGAWACGTAVNIRSEGLDIDDAEGDDER